MARGGSAAAGTDGLVKNSSFVVDQKPRRFGAVVRDLLIERGYVTAIGNPNWRVFANDLPDVSYESLRKAVTGDRDPGTKIMEAVASSLGVEPEVFWEYQLAKALRDFDPSEVGEEVAYANLQKWLRSRRK